MMTMTLVLCGLLLYRAADLGVLRRGGRAAIRLHVRRSRPGVAAHLQAFLAWSQRPRRRGRARQSCRGAGGSRVHSPASRRAMPAPTSATVRAGGWSSSPPVWRQSRGCRVVHARLLHAGRRYRGDRSRPGGRSPPRSVPDGHRPRAGPRGRRRLGVPDATVNDFVTTAPPALLLLALAVLSSIARGQRPNVRSAADWIGARAGRQLSGAGDPGGRPPGQP